MSEYKPRIPICPKCKQDAHHGVKCGTHAPRHEYDCGRCKFNWNCGDLCDCGLRWADQRMPNGEKYPPAPAERMKQVENRQYRWRKSKGY